MAKKKNYQSLLLNQIKIHTSLEQHDNIIRFFGFFNSNRIFAILLETADCDLLHYVTTIKYDDEQMFMEFSVKIAVQIIDGMVCEICHSFNWSLFIPDVPNSERNSSS